MASVNIPLTSFLFALSLSCFATVHAAGDFRRDCDVIWGGDRVKVLENGRLLTLSLDNSSGSGFQSKTEYLYGRFDIKMKLIAGDSAGTVTTYYLTSKGSAWDEIDFEFLGNSSGEPYVVHTNVFAQGKGGREQQFYLWFDPTIKFHTYSIVWNLQHILFLIDDIPIRQYKNLESGGIPFPKNQPMRVVSTLWNADDWATRGGLVKTDWTKAPFTAYYRDFNANACIRKDGTLSCSGAQAQSMVAASGSSQELDAMSKRRLMWARRKFMIYNYCRDKKRFPQGLPKECSL